MAKMNGKAIAQFFIDKGERVGLGLAGVIALVAVGGMTDWSGFDKTPSQLTDGASKAQSALVASAWPETETQTYPVVSLTKLTNDAVVKPLEVSWFDYSTPMSPKIYPKTKALEEPPFLPVESLLADSGTFVMETFPPGLEGTEAAPEGDAEAKDPAAPRGRSARQRRDGAVGAGGCRLPLAGAPAAPGGAAAAAMHGSMSSSSGPAAGMPPAGMHGGAEMMMAGMTGGASPGPAREFATSSCARHSLPHPIGKARPRAQSQHHRRGDAVLAIRRLGDRTSARRSWSVPVAGGGRHLGEGRSAGRGRSPHQGGANWDLEVVQTEVTDATFTMPLPARLVGFWTATKSRTRASKRGGSRKKRRSRKPRRTPSCWNRPVKKESVPVAREAVASRGFNPTSTLSAVPSGWTA